jgi:hypothetical protein
VFIPWPGHLRRPLVSRAELVDLTDEVEILRLLAGEILDGVVRDGKAGEHHPASLGSNPSGRRGFGTDAFAETAS